MTPSASETARTQWERSFTEQVAQQAYNTAPVETLARNVSYYLRARYTPAQYAQLHFLEMGCGTGPNLVWLARKGVRVSGVDIAPTALALARAQLEQAGCRDRIAQLIEAPVSAAPFPDASFDGIVEALVFQHLAKADRLAAFAEVRRLLKPGGLFAGCLLDASHTIFQERQREQLPDDPGTLILHDGRSSIYLNDLGVCHFYRREELDTLLRGFSVVDVSLTTYYLPREEARRRGYETYLQSMWAVYAIK